MGLETGTYISDLVTSNPANSDQESQGAAHLRLIKSVLQNTFPGSSRAWPLPTVPATITASTALTRANFNSTVLVDTTAAQLTVTLPSLVAGDAGWTCTLLKINTNTNAFFIAPAAGNIQSGEATGLSATRRCIPGHPTVVVWSGTAWYATRVPRMPIGSLVYLGTGLPVGYEWANGQVLSSAANYPDYFAILGAGNTVDMRCRAVYGTDNMGGRGTLSLITAANGNWNGAINGNAGGQEYRGLTLANLPNYNPGATFSGTNQNWNANQQTLLGFQANESYWYGAGNASNAVPWGTGFSMNNITTNITPSGSVSLNASINGSQTQTNIPTMPPGISLYIATVVE